jgi:hypothetical protein
MKTLGLKSRMFLRRIFQGASLTAVAFVFQACYGVMTDCAYDVKLSGTVVSEVTNEPIAGIKVSTNDGMNYAFTDENGRFAFFSMANDCIPEDKVVHFTDVDGAQNGNFVDRSMVINPARRNEVRMNIALQEIQ